MSPSVDELILSMQHLQAQAKESLQARALRAGLERIKSSAQKLAWSSQQEVTVLEKAIEDGELKLEQIRQDGVTPQEAPEYIAVRSRVEEARKGLVKARAQLNFALDRMDEVERREYEAFHSDVRAETHGQLAEDSSSGEG